MIELKTASIIALETPTFSPFHTISLLIFLLAIGHTLFVHKLHAFARRLEATIAPGKARSPWLQILFFLSEVEIVFGFWAIPLFFSMILFYDWETAINYINTRDFTEALFVVVIVALSRTRPIVHFAEKLLRSIAHFFGGSLSSWWLTLLTLGPLLGSLITEAGAMTICALLLSRQFYHFRPSQRLAYATIGLLFVNISVGGILTNFASPAVLILANKWGWSSAYTFFTFGWKAACGIVASNLLYLFCFRREFALLSKRQKALKELYAAQDEEEHEAPIPAWITLAHIAFVVAIVYLAHYPIMFIAAFLFFIGFHQATRPHQYSIRLSGPLLIGFFLAGLVIHGGLQGWWVIQLIEPLSPGGVMGASILLTAFNDNTAIAYLMTLIPGWSEVFKYALFTGVIAGGGLTVIGNAPNPAGYAILRRFFPDGIAPVALFKAAFIPTCILYLIFYLFGPIV